MTQEAKISTRRMGGRKSGDRNDSYRIAFDILNGGEPIGLHFVSILEQSMK